MKITPCGKARETDLEVAVDKKVVNCGHTDEDICHCPCHEPGSEMMHFMACCEKCESCGRMILNDYLLGVKKRKETLDT